VFETVKNNSSLIYSKLPERTISEKIYKLRKMNGYSRRKFAEICNIGYTSVCKYESDYSEPNDINLQKICESFNVSYEYFKS
jgi:transcriptional regulator with XRE-family HTH domain